MSTNATPSADSLVRAQQALLDSGLEAILGGILRPLVVLSPDGIIMGINKAARKLAGFGDSEGAGCRLEESPWFLRSPDRMKGMMTAFHEVIATGKQARWSMPIPTQDQPEARTGILFSPVRNNLQEITAVLMERDPGELTLAGAPTPAADSDLRMIVEAARAVPAVWDVDRDCLALHPVAYDVLRIPESYGGRNMAFYLDLVHPEDRAAVRARIDQALADGKELRAEFRVSATPEETWWAVQGSVQRWTSGRPIRIAGAAIDITQQKQAELALKENEALFRAIFEHSTAGIALADLEGRFVHANPAFCKLAGRTEDELRMLRGPDVLHPDHQPIVQRYIDQGNKGDAPPIQSERCWLRPDGGTIWARHSGGPWYRGGEIAGYVVVAQDITLERQAREAIRESESRFRDVADNSPGLLWMADANINKIFLNQAMARFLGPDAAVVTDLTEFLHPDDVDRARAAFAQSAAERSVFKGRYRVRRHDGVYRWLMGEAIPRFSGEDAFVGFAGSATDITDWLQAEQELQSELERRRESEARFRAIFDSSTAGIALLDRDGRFLNANAAYCQMLGYTEAELQQRPVLEIVHPEDRDLTIEYFAAAKNGEIIRTQAERRNLRSDGETIWVRVSGASLARDGVVTGLVAVIQDVTNEKLAIEALKESESRFRAMADSSPAYLWMTDAQGVTNFRNKAAIDFLGPQQATTTGILAVVHPEDRDPAIAVFMKALAEQSSCRSEYRVRRADGVYRWMIGHWTPRLSADGVFLGLSGSAVDITDRLEAERELQKLSESLIQSQERIRQGIASELHDDLGQRVAAQGYALFNLKQKLPALSVESQEAIQRLEESIAKLGADIRDLSHRLHPASLDHIGLVTALKSLAEEFRGGGLRVAALLEEPDEPLPHDIEVNLFRFAQEALSNVMKHSGAREAEMRLTLSNGRTQLRISDHGRGFDPEAHGQRGLGMISMRERARLMGATLTVQSAPGEGTTVVLDLPKRPAAS